MPWPPRQPARDEVAEDERAGWDMVVERARRMGGDPTKDAGYYGRLLLSPILGSKLSDLGRTVRSLGDRGDTYSHMDREFVDQVLSADFKDNIVQHIHLNDAVATGVRIEAIEALRYGREEELNDEEKMLADYIRRVVSGRVDAESYAKIEARMGERGAVEYTIFILFLQLTMRLMSAVGMPAISDEELDKQIAEFRAGTREAEDYRVRIR